MPNRDGRGNMKKYAALAVVLAVVALLTTLAFHHFNQAGIFYSQGHRLFQQRLHEQAIPYYERAVQLRPAFRNALRELALSALWTGRYQRAGECFAALDRIDPDNSFSKRGFADILAWTGHRQEAIPIYRELLERHPYDQVTTLSLADALLWEREYQAAIPLYQAALKRDPAHQEALVRLGLALDGVGRAEEARELFALLEERFPNSPPALRALGMHALVEGAFAVAVRYYERALEIDPRDLESIARLAECEAGLGELSKAMTLVDRAAAQFPDDFAVQLLQAQVHLWAKDSEAAGKYFEGLLQRWPGDPGAIAGLGRTYAWKGDARRALPYLEEAYGRGADPEVGRDLANVYLSLKRGSEAAALYERILPDLHPAPDELAGAANAFMAAGDARRAKALAEQALAADPKSRAAQLVLTDLAIKGRRFGEAESLLRKLVAAGPQDVRLIEKLGDVLMWQGKFAEAQRAYEAAVGGKSGGSR